MLSMITNVTKETLINQLNELMEEGQEVICINRHGAHDFKEFGFDNFITFSLVEFDETVYMTEKSAPLFHDAYSFNSLEFMMSLIEKESWDMLKTVLYYQ